MSQSISTRNAESYIWGEVCTGWHLLQRDDLSVIQELAPAGSVEVAHLHRKVRQFFFVLSGEATIEINGVTSVLGQFQGIEVPPGTPHQFRNESEHAVMFLVVSSPNSRGDRESVR